MPRRGNPVQFYLPEDLHHWLVEAARKGGTTKTAILTGLVRSHFTEGVRRGVLVSLEPAVLARLQDHARADGTTLAGLLRTVLRRHLRLTEGLATPSVEADTVRTEVF